MARITAEKLRAQAREAMLSAGGRGFMRFLPEGSLLATDAIRRCADEAQKARMTEAFEASGFSCMEKDGLLMLTPKDEVLESIGYSGSVEIDWNDALHPVRALGLRWLKKDKQKLTAQGRQLIVETLRLCWQPQQQAFKGAETLRARAAVMLRYKDTSGMHEAGALLLDWCNDIEGGHEHEA